MFKLSVLKVPFSLHAYNIDHIYFEAYFMINSNYKIYRDERNIASLLQDGISTGISRYLSS